MQTRLLQLRGVQNPYHIILAGSARPSGLWMQEGKGRQTWLVRRRGKSGKKSWVNPGGMMSWLQGLDDKNSHREPYPQLLDELGSPRLENEQRQKRHTESRGNWIARRRRRRDKRIRRPGVDSVQEGRKRTG